MKIRHELICEVLRALAGPDGQEGVATDIANQYHVLGGGDLALYPIVDPVAQKELVRRNRINIFQRWLTCETKEHRRKIYALLPAILSVLPDDLAARVLASNSLEYRALDAAEKSIRTAKSAYVRTWREIFVRNHSNENSGGASSAALMH